MASIFGAVKPARKAHWRNLSTGFALEDDERLLGHVVEAVGQWVGFDVTHLNELGSGFRCVGIFPSDFAAKGAVEQSVANRLN
jgi:hypothetical protein